MSKKLATIFTLTIAMTAVIFLLKSGGSDSLVILL